MNTTVFSMILCCVTVSCAVAGEGLPDKVRNEFEYFVGDWTYEAKEGETVVVRDGKWSAKWASGKRCLLCTYSSVGPRGGVEGTQLMLWNPSTKQVVVHDVNSFGDIERVDYTIPSSRHWKGKSRGVEGAGATTSVNAELRGEPKEFTWSLTERRLGDEALPDWVFRFRRMK